MKNKMFPIFAGFLLLTGSASTFAQESGSYNWVSRGKKTFDFNCGPKKLYGVVVKGIDQQIEFSGQLTGKLPRNLTFEWTAAGKTSTTTVPSFTMDVRDLVPGTYPATGRVLSDKAHVSGCNFEFVVEEVPKFYAVCQITKMNDGINDGIYDLAVGARYFPHPPGFFMDENSCAERDDCTGRDGHGVSHPLKTSFRATSGSLSALSPSSTVKEDRDDFLMKAVAEERFNLAGTGTGLFSDFLNNGGKVSAVVTDDFGHTSTCNFEMPPSHCDSIRSGNGIVMIPGCTEKEWEESLIF